MTERKRVPAPLLSRRMPSGVGAMLQPNATGDGEARLTPWFWAMVVVTGAVAGFVGAALMALLFFVQHLAFGVGFDGRGFSAAVARAAGWERALPLLIAGVIGGVGWYLLRRFTPGRRSEVDEVLWTGQGRLSFRRSAGTAVLSEVVIGLGASLGREAAPKLLGAVAGNLAAEWTRLSDPQRRLLVACGAGAGLAAVYNVPLGGALFTAEVLIGWLSHHRVTGAWLLITPLLAFGVLALLALRYPQLYGNGRGMAHDAFLGLGTIGLLAALAVLKPLVTALCLGSGATGGLLTPVLSTGATLGACLGLAWSELWPGSPVGAYALIGAAAMVGAAMQAPLAAIALLLELTHSGFAIMVPIVVATVLATAVARWIDGYSIYSARLTGPVSTKV